MCSGTFDRQLLEGASVARTQILSSSLPTICPVNGILFFTALFQEYKQRGMFGEKRRSLRT